jgi:outer membrane protein TolC
VASWKLLTPALPVLLILLLGVPCAVSQESPRARLRGPVVEQGPGPKIVGDPGMPTLPITLGAALQLANVRPIDIQLAQERVAVAAALLERAQWLWLPTIYLGGDYLRHDGQLQDVAGNIFGTSKSSMMVGAGPNMFFATTDAIFAPLAARQDLNARNAALQTSRNDTLLAVAEAYFNVQQARGELAGAEVVLKHSEELVRRADLLQPTLIPPAEAFRARAELAKRRQAVSAARERWRVTSADLSRLLRLETTVPVLPVEPPYLQIDLLNLNVSPDELLELAMSNRPELAGQQAAIAAASQRVRQETLRPWLPSLSLRGASTPAFGTLAGGYFGGGINDNVSNFSARSDFDIQVMWEWQNLGFGNLAKVREKQAEHDLARLELFRLEDHIAAEVTQALAQAQEAAVRIRDAEEGLKFAAQSVEKNFDALGKTIRVQGELVGLVVRPLEVVAAVQALGQAHNDYYAAIADYDRAQFRLYRAVGQPAQALTANECER